MKSVSDLFREHNILQKFVTKYGDSWPYAEVIFAQDEDGDFYAYGMTPHLVRDDAEYDEDDDEGPNPAYWQADLSSTNQYLCNMEEVGYDYDSTTLRFKWPAALEQTTDTGNDWINES